MIKAPLDEAALGGAIEVPNKDGVAMRVEAPQDDDITGDGLGYSYQISLNFI